MPPFVGRKRRRSPERPAIQDESKKISPAKGRKIVVEKSKPTMSETTVGTDAKASLEANKKFLEQSDEAATSSSDSDVMSEDFEDVLPKRKQVKTMHDGSEDASEWEDALPTGSTAPTTPGPAYSGDLELTLSKEQDFSTLALTDGIKKGPSKIERQIRILTHCVHIQFLMFHNLIRSGWACDEEAKRILLEQLPADLQDRVQKWRVASGLTSGEADQEAAMTESRSRKGEGKGKGKGKGNGKETLRTQRDWGLEAVRQEKGMPDISHGDPLLRLLKELVSYWKRQFRVNAPGLLKQGYKPLSVLQGEVSSFNKDKHDPEIHGERVLGRAGFRRCARHLEGSRDIGAQLFLCLLRSLGLEARLVANLQPIGFGWSKAEEAREKKQGRVADADDEISFGEDEDSSASDSNEKKPKTTAELRSALQKPVGKEMKPTPKPTKGKETSKSTPAARKNPLRRQPARGSKDTPIEVESEGPVLIGSESSDLSDAISVSTAESVEILETASQRRKPNAPYDRSVVFPNYWVEVVSPVTHKVIPVDPVVTFTVATHEEHYAAFEPRGKKADKAKQVLAYVVAYNADGTAKDVTTRYLKRHQWPGKTKGVRMPVEKLPIYNRRGKVKRYVQYDWFKTVMSAYARSSTQNTQVDELEDETDLKPLQITKKAAEKPVEEIETLAGYKQSAEYVLVRHLRRDEALLPDASPVRFFTPTTSKGGSTGTASTKSKGVGKPEPVYRRADVVTVKPAEAWHKEGRAIVPGVQPLKRGPIRAMTLSRKREVEEVTRIRGEAPTQGLYSKDQTDWIVPEPITNGVIPKNAYGTIDVFVPRMVPEGAAHLPWRGGKSACKKLGCDFAEAVVGFEFGNRRAVPVTRGVVVASEWAQAVTEEMQRAEAARQEREDGKRTAAAIGMWRKFLMGLRIVERVNAEYGPENEEAEERNPFINRKSDGSGLTSMPSKATGHKGKAVAKPVPREGREESETGGGGFIVDEDYQGTEDDDSGEGGFMVEDPTVEDDIDDDRDEDMEEEESEEVDDESEEYEE